MKTNIKIFLIALVGFFCFCGSCDDYTPTSSSGVDRATTSVETDPDGHTVEQKNIIDRLAIDNTPGSIKHLYVISAYSGQVIMYSTVRGKVTSGSKRLSPSTVNASSNMGSSVYIGDQTYETEEIISDDGAYGSSGDYIFWFDSKGAYHQHYNSGGQIIHISDQPLAVSSVTINIEATADTTK